MPTATQFGKFLAIAALGYSLNASAAVITLDFEGVASQAAINGFYNGGTDSQGNSGVNYGVQFSSNALALRESDPIANIGNLPPPGDTGMIFLTGSSAILDYSAGFTTGFSFFYSSVSVSAVVRVFSGLGATGDLLGTISLPALGTGPSPGNPFSNWSIASLAFVGDARSIDFGGSQNQVVYDNITFGSTNPTPQPTPEPASLALTLLALAALAGVSRRRKR